MREKNMFDLDGEYIYLCNFKNCEGKPLPSFRCQEGDIITLNSCQTLNMPIKRTVTYNIVEGGRMIKHES